MSGTAPLVATRCAICGTTDAADEVHPANVSPAELDAAIFSARRRPDGVHWRMVRCRACGLLRSDPTVPPEHLAALYRESTFDEREVANLRRTYRQALAALDRFGARKDDLLEIGAGTGFVLEEARALGYRRTVGVEPSAQAADVARARGSEMVVDVMRAGLFPPASFDVVCLFQTLDHLPDPAAVLDESRRVLRQGGLVLAFNHDAGAASARLLGARSPIVDVEHTYLFDRTTMRRLFQARGFDVLAVGGAPNLVSLRHVAHLAPIPRVLRRLAPPVSLWLRLGNLRLVGRAP